MLSIKALLSKRCDISPKLNFKNKCTLYFLYAQYYATCFVLLTEIGTRKVKKSS